MTLKSKFRTLPTQHMRPKLIKKLRKTNLRKRMKNIKKDGRTLLFNI